MSSFQPIICCQNELTELFLQNSPSLPQNSVRLSEFSPPKQYSRNSIPPVSYTTSYQSIMLSFDTEGGTGIQGA